MFGNHNAKIYTISELSPGDHLCCIYENDEEHRVLLTPYLRTGLEKNEKVVYIVDERTAETITGYLKSDGVDVDSYIESGQFSVLSVRDSYVKGGAFDPDRMISLLRSTEETALAQGYTALRVTGEMSWALRGLPGVERLIEYEAKLNNYFPGSRCLAICQYDRRKFDPEILMEVLTTHPIAVIGVEVYTNFYYIPPDEFLGSRLPEARLEYWIKSLARARNIEEMLKNEINFASNTINTLSDVFYAFDLSGKFIRWNEELKRVSGYGDEELAMMKPTDFFRDGDMNRVSEAIEIVLREGRSKVEARFHTKSGRNIPYEFTGSRLVRYDGKVIGFAGIGRDITDRLKYQKKLETHIREMEILQRATMDREHRIVELKEKIKELEEKLRAR